MRLKVKRFSDSTGQHSPQPVSGAKSWPKVAVIKIGIYLSPSIVDKKSRCHRCSLVVCGLPVGRANVASALKKLTFENAYDHPSYARQRSERGGSRACACRRLRPTDKAI